MDVNCVELPIPRSLEALGRALGCRGPRPYKVVLPVAQQELPGCWMQKAAVVTTSSNSWALIGSSHVKDTLNARPSGSSCRGV
mmetsp:Transcript_18373/g.51763  ORF Transcript_18373/g.51763 Transcript_18373/m.51763 type:complete len:83 (-) Transcript_18373:719-967(-)